MLNYPNGFTPIGVFKRHISTFTRIAWAPDGKRLAAASTDGQVLIWSLSQLENQSQFDPEDVKPELRCLGHRSIVYAVVWSPDGNRIASVSEDGTLYIWNVRNIRGTIGTPAAKKDFPDSLYSVDWSSDGQLLAVGSRNGDIYVGYQGIRGMKWQKLFESHPYGVNDLAWYPGIGERLLASVSGGSTELWLWDMTNLKKPTVDKRESYRGDTVRTHMDSIHDVCWAKDGTLIATAGAERSVCIWSFDIKKGKTLEQCDRDWLMQFRNIVTSVSFSHPGDILAVKAENVVIYRREGTGWQRTIPLPEQKGTWCAGLAFNPRDPYCLATLGENGDGGVANTAIRIWNINPHELEVFPYDAFLSFRHEDQEQVVHIKERLVEKAPGLKTWIYIHDQKGGGELEKVLRRALKNSKTLICFVGKDGLSHWQQWEISEFRKMGNSPIIPVILPNVGTEPVLSDSLKGYIWTDYRNAYETADADLLKKILNSTPEESDE